MVFCWGALENPARLQTSIGAVNAQSDLRTLYCRSRAPSALNWSPGWRLWSPCCHLSRRHRWRGLARRYRWGSITSPKPTLHSLPWPLGRAREGAHAAQAQVFLELKSTLWHILHFLHRVEWKCIHFLKLVAFRLCSNISVTFKLFQAGLSLDFYIFQFWV